MKALRSTVHEDNTRVEMLRGEAASVKRERWQAKGFIIAAIALLGWHFDGNALAPMPLLILVVVGLLGAIHHQLCGMRLDTIYREIREQSPGVWKGQGVA